MTRRDLKCILYGTQFGTQSISIPYTLLLHSPQHYHHLIPDIYHRWTTDDTGQEFYYNNNIIMDPQSM